MRLLGAYIEKLGVTLAGEAYIFRNRSGAPYSKDTLGDDFRTVREAEFDHRAIAPDRVWWSRWRGTTTTETVAAQSAIVPPNVRSCRKSNRTPDAYSPCEIDDQ